MQIHSGPRIPSNILSEVDRKIDDGIANSGDMVFNEFDPALPHSLGSGFFGEVDSNGGNPPLPGECTNTVGADFKSLVGGDLKTNTVELFWRTTDRDPAVENNCGASVFI